MEPYPYKMEPYPFKMEAQSVEHESDEISQELCDKVKKFILLIFYLKIFQKNSTKIL